MKKNINIIIFIFLFITIGVVTVISKDFLPRNNRNNRNKELVSKEKTAIMKLVSMGKYKCCLKEPCSRCFAKKKNHDKELVCDCLEDILNGKHPCGECLGEILEGEGNELISEYFAKSISEKLGNEHLDTFKKIISEKYPDMPIEEQL